MIDDVIIVVGGVDRNGVAPIDNFFVERLDRFFVVAADKKGGFDIVLIQNIEDFSVFWEGPSSKVR